MSLVILTNIFLVPAFRLVLIPIRLFSSFFYWNDYIADRKEVRIKIFLLALSAFSQSLKNLMLKSIATLSMDTANSRQTESTTTNRKKPQLLKRNHTYLHHNANWMEFSRSSCFSFCYGSNYERLCNKNAKRKQKKSGWICKGTSWLLASLFSFMCDYSKPLIIRILNSLFSLFCSKLSGLSAVHSWQQKALK